MRKGRILLVASNASRIEVAGGTRPTRYAVNELVVPTLAAMDAGYAVVLATPSGARPVLDEAARDASHFGNDEQRLNAAVDFIEHNPVMQKPRALRAVVDAGLEDYAGVFVPGGMAPPMDLMQDAELGVVLRHFHDRSKPTALLGYGSIATLAAMTRAREFRAALRDGDVSNAATSAGDWPYTGYRMTVFSNAEQRALADENLNARMSFHAATALRIAGARVAIAPNPFEPHVVEHGELITGQNPASDHKIAAAFVAALERY